MVTMSNEYMRAYMAERRAKRKAWAIAELGGKCVVCGSTERLEFDHINRDRFKSVTSLLQASWAVFEAEVRKCQLLCRPHHLEKTAREVGAVEHGGGASGKKNCPCGPCKARKAEYMRTYQRPSNSDGRVPLS